MTLPNSSNKNLFNSMMIYMNPIVSIITPTYNHEKYIGECIESVLNQTFKKWEMIIIDDGSTDNTGEVVSSYDDDRIIYIKQENQGPYKLGITYNKALKLSKGEYIAMLEGDDFWPSKKLEHQLKAFDDNNVVFTHGRAKYVYSDGSKCNLKDIYIREINSIVNNNPIGTALYGLLGLVGSTPIAVTVMIRKSALESIGGFQKVNYVPLTDNPTELELSLRGEFKYVKKNLGYFRRHDHSITHKIRDDKIKMSLLEYRINFLSKNAEKISKLNIPVNRLHNALMNKNLISSSERSLIHANELQNLGKYKESRLIFVSIIKNKISSNITYRFLAIIGLIGSYFNLNLLDIIFRCFSRLESIYSNFTFKYNS